MPSPAKQLITWIAGGFGLLALVFGAMVTITRPASASECQYDGETFMGQQPSYFACVSACYAVHGENLEDVLWGEANGCCRCLY
jgi:hypothetical protein